MASYLLLQEKFLPFPERFPDILVVHSYACVARIKATVQSDHS